MREILFRGKRKNDGEWVLGFYERTWLTNGEVITEIRDVEEPFRMQVFHEVIPETVGQYTGLTDKNGKRIFEGDIISFKMYSALGYLRCRIGVVQYCDRSARFYVLATTGDAWNLCECEDIEVIGNIHDNPEVLRDGEQNAVD